MRLVADLKSVAEFGLAPHNEAVVSQSARALGSDTASIVEASFFATGGRNEGGLYSRIGLSIYAIVIVSRLL